jgi:hypothetical protein
MGNQTDKLINQSAICKHIYTIHTRMVVTLKQSIPMFIHKRGPGVRGPIRTNLRIEEHDKESSSLRR